jgi:hypothetical protein
MLFHQTCRLQTRTPIIHSRQIGLRIRALDKFAQARFNRGLGEQLAKELNLLPQFGVGNWLQKLFGDAACNAVEFLDLRGGEARDFERIAFGHELANQANLLCLGCVNAPPGQQQVAHNSVAQIALQTRDAAKAGDQPNRNSGKQKRAILSAMIRSHTKRQLKAAAKVYQRPHLTPNAAETYGLNGSQRG